jgi:hypothetical protein
MPILIIARLHGMAPVKYSELAHSDPPIFLQYTQSRAFGGRWLFVYWLTF